MRKSVCIFKGQKKKKIDVDRDSRRETNWFHKYLIWASYRVKEDMVSKYLYKIRNWWKTMEYLF